MSRNMLMKGMIMLTIGAASVAQAERSRVLLQDGETRIDVIVDGVGEGDAIVLLPSSQRGSDDLDAVAEQLAARGMRVLRPQPRGFGASRGEMKDLTLHVLAQDVAATIRQLGAGRAIVAGHAYGHYVARVADLDHPQLVRGVVMLAQRLDRQPLRYGVGLGDARRFPNPLHRHFVGIKVCGSSALIRHSSEWPFSCTSCWQKLHHHPGRRWQLDVECSGGRSGDSERWHHHD